MGAPVAAAIVAVSATVVGIVVAVTTGDDTVSPECTAAIAEAEYYLENHPTEFAETAAAIDAAEATCEDDFER